MLLKTMHGRPLVYLDTAATAQKPQHVIDTISNFYRKDYGTVHRAMYELSIHATQEYQRVRSSIAKYLNAAAQEEVIYTRDNQIDKACRLFLRQGVCTPGMRF